jgi:exoribonuclease-2
MLARNPREGSLVLYKGRPARVQRVGEKVDLLLPQGETVHVRSKDVVVLHPGPLPELAVLEAPLERQHVQGSSVGLGHGQGEDRRDWDAEVQAAWEILAGGTTDLAELAELIYGAYTPATAWAAWELVADGLYFRGAPGEVSAATPEELAVRTTARAAEAVERQAREAFLQHARAGQLAREDARYLGEVEALALGRSAHSRVLQALDKEDSPEAAHAFLLKVGYWSPAVDPYPARLGLSTSPSLLPVPELPRDGRRDLTHLLALAIDDASTDIPDDALSLEGERLWVHVADPAAVVGPGSELDLEARARGASLYLPEGTVHMLPAAANAIFALGLSGVSPALSLGLDIDPASGEPGLEIVPSWIRVSRLTYEEAEAQLDADVTLARLYRLAQSCWERRRARGAISIELPEVDIKLALEEPAASNWNPQAPGEDASGGRHKPGTQPAPAGVPLALPEVLVSQVLPLRSRRIVEEAMVLAGEAVARLARQHAIPMPYATQEAPAEVTLPRTLSEMYALRRTLLPRRYQPVPGEHAGLGLPAYVQATSPMRRCLDLVAHQQLRAFIAGNEVLNAGEIVERIGEVDAVSASLRQAERFADQHWLMVYLLAHPGWHGEAVLVEKRGLSGTFLIPELALETHVRLQSQLPLDSRASLSLSGVDLPRLEARFRIT